MTPWKLPLIVAALAVPIVAAFYIGGGGVGVAAGALTAVALVVYAANQRPRGPIVPAPTADRRRHVLLVATCPVEEPGDVAEIARAGGLDPEADDVDVLVLAPARIRFLDRWASDVEPARQAAQRTWSRRSRRSPRRGSRPRPGSATRTSCRRSRTSCRPIPATDVVLVSGAERRGGGRAGGRRTRIAARGRVPPSRHRRLTGSADVGARGAAHDLEGAAGDRLELVEVLVVPAPVAAAAEVPVGAVVGDDHPVALEGDGDRPRRRR